MNFRKLILGKGPGKLSKVAGIEGPTVNSPGQLYDLYTQHPGIVRELSALGEAYKTLGHSKRQALDETQNVF